MSDYTGEIGATGKFRGRIKARLDFLGVKYKTYKTGFLRETYICEFTEEQMNEFDKFIDQNKEYVRSDERNY